MRLDRTPGVAACLDSVATTRAATRKSTDRISGGREVTAAFRMEIARLSKERPPPDAPDPSLARDRRGRERECAAARSDWADEVPEVDGAPHGGDLDVPHRGRPLDGPFGIHGGRQRPDRNE